MRFSTRRFRASKIFKILVPATAILVLGFVVSQVTRGGARAENASNGKIYYVSKADIAARAAADERPEDQIRQAYLGGGMAACADTADYYVVASTQSLCENYDLSADNAFQIYAGGYTALNDTRLFSETDLGSGRTPGSDGSNRIGYLGAFHVIAFDNLDADVQVYGNIATNNLESSSNNNINHFTVPTISYVKAMSDDVHLSSFAPATEGLDTSIFVVGSEDESAINFTAKDGGGTWTMNGSDRKVNDSVRSGNGGFFLDNVWVDRDDEFLNLNSMESQAIALSQEFAEYEDTLTADNYNFIKDNDHPIQYVHLADPYGLNILNLTSADLVPVADGALDIIVDGFTTKDDGQGGRVNAPATLLLNVDLASLEPDPATGKKNYDQGFGVRICYNSADDFVDNNSVQYDQGRYCLNQTYYHDRFEHHVIINYYDSSEPDGIYRGGIDAVDPRGTTQFTLAPGADVMTHGTPYQGVIIANNVELGGDSYYLSLHDLQPLQPVVENCTLNIFHKNKRTGQVILGYAIEHLDLCSENHRYEISKSADIESLGYSFVDADYEDGGEGSVIIYRAGGDDSIQTMISDGETIDAEFMPISSWNDLPSKTINLYYDELCSLVVHHVNYTTGATIRDDDPVTYVCGEIAEVGHAADLISQGYVPVLNDGSEMPVPDETLPIGVNEKPTEVTVYYKKRCTVTVMHLHDGTNELLPTDGDNPEVYTGFCGEFEETINIASELLGTYDFVDAIEVESDDHYDSASFFPLSTDTVRSDMEYHLYYDEKSVPETCSISVHHYLKGTTTVVGAPDEEISTTHYCGNVNLSIPISETALNNGYIFYSAKIESDTEIIEDGISSSSFPLSATNDIPVKIITVYYEPTTTPEFCHYEVHHWDENGTKELADAEYYDDIRCDNIPKNIDKSSKLTSDGYSVIKAHFDNDDEDIELPYSFAPTDANVNYVFNIYYKKTSTPDTSASSSSVAFTVAGASIALGAVLFVRARRS